MKLLIHPSRLHSGEIRINGYKHSMVQLIALAVALNQKTLIKNIPLVEEVFVLQQILRKIGCVFDIKDRTVYIDPTDIFSYCIDEKLSTEIHGSMYLFAALAVRFDKVRFFESGGCQIGDAALQGKRPFMHILDVLQEFGYIVHKYQNDYAFIKSNPCKCLDIMKYSDNQKYLSGSCISSATKVGILLSAKLGNAKIFNPYMKNDVMDMLRYLTLCGYAISVDKKHIEIVATDKKTDVVEFVLSDCVSEVITYITLALMNNIKLKLKISNLRRLKKALASEFLLMKRAGLKIECANNEISINPKQKINALNFKVLHTTIQSDHHPFFALLLTKAQTASQIREYVWRDRFKYVQELNKLGFNIVRTGNKIDVYPSAASVRETSLNGCDTRASALLIIASLTAHTNIEILNAEHLTRGYGDFIDNLRRLGANIESVA